MRIVEMANVRFGLALLMLLCGASEQCEAASDRDSPAASVLRSDQDLDKLLAARDWNALGRELSTGASLNRSMDWLRSRIESGGGLMLVILYARDLWVVGKNQTEDAARADLQLSAASMSLYALELISIDGVKCADRTAPGHRLDQLFAARRETLAFLKAQPSAVKSAIIDRAIQLEKRTAPLRPDDDLICRDGSEQTRAALEHGQQREIPAAPGQNKTVIVTPPAGWTPKFLPAEAYRPLQDRARSTMRETLVQLLS